MFGRLGLANFGLRNCKGVSNPIPGLKGCIGFYMAKGLINEQMSANPVWKDKSGKGNDLQMKNFAWAEMSGVGGYNYNFTKTSIFNYVGPNIGAKVSSDTLFIEKVDRSRVNCVIKLNQFKCQLKVTGVTKAIDNGEIQRLRIYSSKDMANSIYIEKDGIYDVDVLNPEDGEIYIFANSPQIDTSNPLTLTSPIAIEQLPLYSGAIVFDGVDDYGICDNFPILTKEKGYTVMALRKWIRLSEISSDLKCIVSNASSTWNGAFILEYSNYNPSNNISAYNFGKFNNAPLEDSVFTYQTSKSYNNTDIAYGNGTEGTNKFLVGKVYETRPESANIAIYSICIIDHDTTEEERELVINKWKQDYPELFFDQAWTVTGKTNEDSDRATIKNLTGNGNNLTLSNFGFAENSGYGLYQFDFTSSDFSINLTQAEYYNGNKVVLNSLINSVQILYFNTNINIRLKVTGLDINGCRMSVYDNINNSKMQVYHNDGIFDINYKANEGATRIYFYVLGASGKINPITIEQIPDYEGYLVTDGVDDKIISSSFDLGKDWTMIGDWKFIENKTINAGIVKASSLFLYNRTTGCVAYVNSGEIANSLNGIKSLNAVCSDGRVYDNNWNEILTIPEVRQSGSVLEVGERDGRFTQIAFKNLAFYNNKILSKEECIKAYNYLQILKEK